VEVAGVAVGRLEARAAFTEIDLAREPRVDHPLQRAVDRGAADAAILAAHEVEQIVRAQVSLLAQKNREDAIAFTGALAPGRPERGEIGNLAGQSPTHHVALFSVDAE
jgi:hypothetical protein